MAKPGIHRAVASLTLVVGTLSGDVSNLPGSEPERRAFLGPLQTIQLPVKGLAPAGPVLSLEQLLTLAGQNNPDIAIARNLAEAARGRLLQAGLYPNPTLMWAGSQILHRRNAGGEEGPLLTQQFVTAGKLRLAEQAAAQGVAAADWQAMTRWYDVLTRVRLAYYEVLAARAEVAANAHVVRLADEGLEAARKLQKIGAGTQPDVLQARVEWNQNRQRLEVARTREATAWRLLATAAGLTDLPPGNLEERFSAAAPALEWQALVDAVLARSSEIKEAQANLAQAHEAYLRQVAERVPNIQLGVRPFYSFPDQDKRLYVEIGAVLPLFNRNQGNIHTAAADMARARHELRQVELRLTARLGAAYQRYRAAAQQTESYQKEILPDAAESLRLVRLGYERGDPKYDYTTLLQSQRTLAHAQLAHVQALGDLWRAVFEIAGLYQANHVSEMSAAPQ
jgi:cobalt-zinc-cadmium efflux system outer membrane protein